MGSSGWNCSSGFFPPRFTRENLKLGDGGEEGATTTSRERRSFHFVNDGIEHALDQAREAAGDRDVRAR